MSYTAVREAHHQWKGDEIGYLAAHERVYAARGKASEYTCACGADAREWAYNHDDPNERRQATGRFAGRPYSTDPEHYTPMCSPCHNTADKRRKHWQRNDLMQNARVRVSGSERTGAEIASRCSSAKATSTTPRLT